MTWRTSRGACLRNHKDAKGRGSLLVRYGEVKRYLRIHVKLRRSARMMDEPVRRMLGIYIFLASSKAPSTHKKEMIQYCFFDKIFI